MQPEENSNEAGIGGGVYDAECGAAMLATEALCVCLMVIEGNRGNGFSVATHNPEIAASLPKILREMADQIEGVLAKAKDN
jgi:hypothetical protein